MHAVYLIKYIFSNFQALMNLIKGTIGTGILSLPYAFKESGLWVIVFRL